MPYLTNAGTLAEEVSDLLRHDNIDSMILTWMSMVYDDLSQRLSVAPFTSSKTGTITANSSTSAILVASTYMGDMITAVFVNSSDGVVSMPQYRTMIDYTLLAHVNIAEGGQYTGSYPLIWSVGPQSAPGNFGQDMLYVLPELTVNTYYTILYTNVSQQAVTDPTSFYTAVPYWMEQILIWGAVTEGAKSLNQQLYPVAKAEYEQRVKDMLFILSYTPDYTPIRRDIGGPYMRTYKMRPIPNWPATIS